MVLCGVVAGSRAVDMVWMLTEPRRVSGTYPAVGQALRTLALVDGAIVIVSLVIAALVWSLLRPRAATPPGGEP